MIESIKKVNNPLTIIAIFAALAEIASVVAINYVNSELHYIFIWFVMGFPVLLVTFFFATLNFNAKVLYAPSDFKDDQSFLQTLNVKQVSVSLETVHKELEEAKTKIITEATNQITTTGETERKKLSEIVNKQIGSIQEKVEVAQYDVEHLTTEGLIELNRKKIEIHKNILLDAIKNSNNDYTYNELFETKRVSAFYLSKAINELISEKKIKKAKRDGFIYFEIVDSKKDN